MGLLASFLSLFVGTLFIYFSDLALIIVFISSFSLGCSIFLRWEIYTDWFYSILLNYYYVLICAFLSLFFNAWSLICEYLMLSCWSHCIWIGIKGDIGMFCYVFGLTLSLRSNSLEILPLELGELIGSRFISRVRVYFRPKLIYSVLWSEVLADVTRLWVIEGLVGG